MMNPAQTVLDSPSPHDVETAWRQLADDLGPAEVRLLREPAVGLEAFVVLDNLACGPAIGGLRMAPVVTVAEVARLARAMTLKNAGAGLPHGGAKAGIVADPHMAPAAKEALVRAFARAIRTMTSYVPGPDMGTDERCMAWIHDEIGRAVGLPRVLGGIPLDEIGATGYGLAVAAEVAQEFAGFPLRGARVAIEGFGAVGKNAARFLAERGAVVVAVADRGGAIGGADGLPIPDLIALQAQGDSVAALPGGRRLTREEFFAVDCDIWIPAARPDVLTAETVPLLRARLVLQGANIPATPAAEAILHARNILSVPDVVANAGGVICAAVENRGGGEQHAFAAIDEKIRASTRAVLELARARAILPRQAATELARARVEEAAQLRRWHR